MLAILFLVHQPQKTRINYSGLENIQLFFGLSTDFHRRRLKFLWLFPHPPPEKETTYIDVLLHLLLLIFIIECVV